MMKAWNSANEYRMREVIEKYCSFMPVNIYLSKANAEQEYETIDEADLTEMMMLLLSISMKMPRQKRKKTTNGEKEIVEVSPAKRPCKD